MHENMHEKFHIYVNVELRRKNTPALSHPTETEKNQRYCRTEYDENYNLFFYFASSLLDGTCRMTSIEVRALPDCLGFTPYYVSPVFVVHCHASPGGTVCH